MLFRKWKKHLFFLTLREKDSSVNKGNAGFRPVINWREIAIRKKRVANKQILQCIISVGVIMIALGVTFLVLGLFVINTTCPVEWDSLNDGCVYLSTHNGSWQEVNEFCSSKGAFMVELLNEVENTEFSKMLKGPTWIGFFKPRNERNFQWLSGVSLAFTKWNPRGRVAMTAANIGRAYCVMTGPNGLWTAESTCNNDLIAACEYDRSYNPFVLIGPVVIGCGFIVLFLSVEVCQRHREDQKRGFHVPEDEEELIKKKPSDVESTASPEMILDSPSDESLLVRMDPPRKTKIKPKKTRNLFKKNKIKADMSIEDDEDVLTVTRSLSRSPSKEQLELLLTPRNL